LTQFSMQRSRREPLMVQYLPSLNTIISLLGIGTEADMDALTIGNRGSRTGFDAVFRSDAIVSVTLRDGPLSNFCILGRTMFDLVNSGVLDLTPEDTTKVWKTLERILDAPHLPLVHASAEVWVKFDQLRALVRDSSQTVEKVRPLLDMIEKIDYMRPPTDWRAEGTANVDNQIRLDGSADQETLELNGPPIPGPSRQVEASHIERGPVATFPPPLPGTIPLAEMPQSSPHGWTSHSSSDLDWVTIDDSTSSTPTTQPDGSVESDTPQLGVAPIAGSSRQAEVSRAGVGGPMDPRLAPSVQASIRTAGIDPFAPRGWTSRSAPELDPVAPDTPSTSLIPTIQAGPHVPQMHLLAFTTPTYMPSLSRPRRAFSLDDANFRIRAHTQPVLMDIPLPPRHILAHPSLSSSSPGPPVVPQLGHVNQGGRVPDGGRPTPDPNSGAGTYLFLILQYLATD
jgi:hypothetical protein